MAVEIQQLEVRPGYESIGVRSHFSGEEDHTAILEYRGAGSGSWIPGTDMERDLRENILNGDSSWKTNPYRYQNRAPVLFLASRQNYDVRVQYFDAINDYIGVRGDTVTLLDDDPPSTGGDYYVTPAGNDADSGEQGSPWRTIGYAFGQLSPGDTLYISGEFNVGQVDITRSGQIDNYITIRGLDPNNQPVVTGNNRGIFRILNSSYIRIKDIDFRNTMTDHGICVLLSGDCKGCIVEDHLMTVQGNGWWCSGVCMTPDGSYAPSDTLIQGNDVTQLVPSNGYGVLANGGNGVGIRGSVIRHNKFHGPFWDTIGGGGNFYEDNGLSQDSHVHDNFIEDSRGDALELEGGLLNCSAWNNFITKQNGYFCIAMAAVVVGPLYIFRNIVEAETVSNGCFKTGEHSDGVVNIYHNSIRARNDVLAASGSPYDHRNLKFRNNIMWVTGGNQYVVEDGSGLVDHDSYDYNLMISERGSCIKYGGAIQYYEQWRTNFGQEPHGLFAGYGGMVPVFVDYPNGDYRLAEGSPAIDAGVIIPGINDSNSPWPYQGGAPDIGAIESGIVGPPNASFTVDVDSGEAPLTVQFTNTTMGAVDSELWNFGDGETSTELHPSHVYQNAGTFEVGLTVTGPGGSDNAYMAIEVTQVFNLTIIAGAGGTTEPEPGQYVRTGVVRLTALPGSDYRFAGWEEAGAVISTDNPADIFMDRDREITAVFEYVEPPPGEYVVSIVSLGEGYTSPLGDVSVVEGDTLEIEAHPREGWVLDRWDGDISGNDNPTNVVVTQNMTVVAIFKEKTQIGMALAGVGLIVSIIAVAKRGGPKK